MIRPFLVLRSSLLMTLAAASVLPAQQRERAAPPDPAVLAARVDSVVHTDVLALGMPSVSVAIMRGDDIVLARAWGLADAVTERRAEPSTPYQVGSVSKTFTAALILRLADRGKLSIGDPISRHFAGLPPEWEAITIEQLLNHTSGLKAEFRQVQKIAEPRTSDSLWSMATGDTLANVPGTKFVYSNTGYMMLGALIERLHGKRYADVLRDEIATPLGLESLHVCTIDDPRAARGHVRSPGETARHISPMHPSQLLGNGGICSTASDIARWNRALHGGRVLSAASYAAMTTPRGDPAVARNYGLGLYVRPAAWGTMTMLHEGTTFGFASANAWYPPESLSVVVLYNGVPRLPKDVDGIISQIALGFTPGAAAAPAATPQPATIPAAAGPRAPADASRFAGEYEVFPGARFVVALDDGVLFVTPPAVTGGSRQVLVHQSGSTYRVGGDGSNTTITFVLDTADAVTAMRTRAGDGTVRTMKKVK